MSIEKDIRKRVEKRYKRRREFLTGLGGFIVFNIITWALWGAGLTFDLTLPWPLFLMLMGIASLFDGLLDATMTAEVRSGTLEQRTERAMQRIYGQDWLERGSHETYREIEKALAKRTNKRTGLVKSMQSFVLSNLAFWLAWWSGFTLGLPFPWPLPITTIWLIALTVRGVELLLLPNEVRFYRQVEEEAERIHNLREKRKHGLSDDSYILEQDDKERSQWRD